MSTVLQLLLLTLAVPLVLFVLYGFAMFLLSGLALLQSRSPAPATNLTRFVVLVPAHDEELLIGQTVSSILAARTPLNDVELFVIADNCSDRTSDIAQAHGARCLVRNDIVNRGKPYALDWAIRQLTLDLYDALVIVDADTRIDASFFERMAARLARGSTVLQGYFGVLNPDETWLTRLALLPGALKFKLHWPAKEMLGLSCPLAGNGMCFDIEVIKRFGWNAFSLTENWEYWAQLTLENIRTDSAPDAVIYSQVANSLSAGESQRMRWMRGRMDTSRRFAGALLKRGLAEASAMKLDATLELVRPSHANLLFWSGVYFGAAVVAYAWDPSIQLPLLVAGLILCAQISTYLTGFLLDRPPLKTWAALFMVPAYLAWKLLVSVRGAAGAGDRAWVRTKRNQP